MPEVPELIPCACGKRPQFFCAGKIAWFECCSVRCGIRGPIVVFSPDCRDLIEQAAADRWNDVQKGLAIVAVAQATLGRHSQAIAEAAKCSTNCDSINAALCAAVNEFSEALKKCLK